MSIRANQWGLSGVFLSLTCIAAQAQNAPPPPSPQFSAILQSQKQRDAVIETAKHSTTWIRHGCGNASFSHLPLIKIWKRPEFDSANAPMAGQWGQRVEASGCGITRLLNVLTSVRSMGVLINSLLAPGDTSADPTLQIDASRYAFATAIAGVQGCRDAYIDNTQAIRNEVPEPSDVGITGPVKVEHWTIVACGHNIVVGLKFSPTATGTTIVAHTL